MQRLRQEDTALDLCRFDIVIPDAQIRLSVNADLIVQLEVELQRSCRIPLLELVQQPVADKSTLDVLEM